MRTANRRPILTTLALLASGALLTGCGDAGNQLPAGMSGTSHVYSGSTAGDLLGSDPGPLTAGVRSGVDDPVLADTYELDEVGSLSGDDPYARAVADWNDSAGVLGEGLDDVDLDPDLMEDDFLPAGYGGYDDGWGHGGGYGYGGGVLAAASYGGAGMMDAGFIDPGFEDPGLMDAGIEDPGFVDGGFDAGFVDAGLDVGFVDAGFDAGVDPGFIDAGVADVGMDPGFVDVGAVDVGGFDAGFVF